MASYGILFLFAFTCSIVKAAEELEIFIPQDVTVGENTEVKCVAHFTGSFTPLLVNSGKTITQPLAVKPDDQAAVIYTFLTQPIEGPMFCLMMSVSRNITSKTVIILDKDIDDAVKLGPLPRVSSVGEPVNITCITNETGNYQPKLSMNHNLYDKTDISLNGKQLTYLFSVKADPGPVSCILNFLDTGVKLSSRDSLLTIQGGPSPSTGQGSSATFQTIPWFKSLLQVAAWTVVHIFWYRFT